jgi:hypothetical protein
LTRLVRFPPFLPLSWEREKVSSFQIVVKRKVVWSSPNGQLKTWKRLKILPLLDDNPLESIENSLTRPG